MVVCDDPYDAMEMVRDFLLSKKDWLVTEVHGQWFEEGAVLVVKPEIPQAKYAVICDNTKRIFYAGDYYKEIEHYSVIHTIPNNAAEYTFSFQYHKIPLPFLSIEYLQIVLQKST